MGRTGPVPEILRRDVRARYGRNLNTETTKQRGLIIESRDRAWLEWVWSLDGYIRRVSLYHYIRRGGS